MKNKTCSTCLYWREPMGEVFTKGRWCSNSQSVSFRMCTQIDDTCSNYSRRDKKAPLWLRAVNWMLKRRRQ